MNFSRRKLLAGASATIVAAVLPAPARTERYAAVLRVVKRDIEVNRRGVSVFGIVGSTGKPGMYSLNSSQLGLRLQNDCGEDTLVHWHGLTPPPEQDGVPTLSQPLLAPGAAYDYDLPVRRPGTYWMHSHHALQEQQLLAAPLIIAASKEWYFGIPNVVIMLHDFTFRNPQDIFAELTGGMAVMDHGAMGEGVDMSGGMAGMDHGAMPMGKAHLNDVEFDAYLANDRTLDDPEVVTVEAGAVLRLRIINGAASTNFWIDLGALEGRLVAVDASDCRSTEGGLLSGHRFPIAMSQRLDIVVSVPSPGAYPILALREGGTAQTGIILATPGAAVSRVAGHAAETAPALGVDLAKRLTPRKPPLAKAADRRLTLGLTGSMMGFVWGLNGFKYGSHQPLAVRQNERVEIEMVNRTDMSHPIHLHGHTFQVVEIDGQRIDGPMRDTVLVPVNGRVAIAFDADNPGRWAFHCHNLYHMAAGMMTTLEYEA